MEEVAGFREGELDKLKVIEALLGDDGRLLLESHSAYLKSLKKVIEDDLVHELGDD